MELVGVEEFPAETRGEQGADGALAQPETPMTTTITAW
jgi:hypothetical protein